VLEQVDAATPRGAAILWINARAEPVLYLNGRPWSLKRSGDPRKHCEFANGDPGHTQALEMILKGEVLEERTRYGGRVLVHEESDACSAAWLPLEEVLTVQEAFDEVRSTRSSPKVDFLRWPVNDTQAPMEARFNEIARKLCNLHGERLSVVKVICNCHQGRGRTTTAMMIVHMLLDFIWQAERHAACPAYTPASCAPLLLFAPVRGQPLHNVGSWDEKLREGHSVAVACAGLYDDMLNLYDAMRDKYDSFKKSTSHDAHLELCHCVERFSYVVLFATFLQHCREAGNCCTLFRQWMHNLQSEFSIYTRLHQTKDVEVIATYMDANSTRAKL